MHGETKLLIGLLCYVGLDCLFIAYFPDIVPRNTFLTGLALGSIFGTTILASVWFVYVPSPLSFRLVLTTALLVALPFALSKVAKREFYVPVILSQILLFASLSSLAWSIKAWLGFQLQASDGMALASGTRTNRQFAIRHLLMITTAFAILFAASRILGAQTEMGRGILLFGLMAFGTCLICVPFTIAVLSRSASAWPTVFAIALAVGITFLETVLFGLLNLFGPELLHFAGTNFFALVPLLGSAIGLRQHGYRFEFLRAN